MNQILYYAPSMEGLADRICHRSCGGIRGEIWWNRFSDGWPNFEIVDKGLIRGNDVAFLAAFEKPADVFEQLSVIYAIPRFEARSFTLILPDFPTGTMERLDADSDGEEVGKIATAMTLARMLSAIPLSGHGPAKIAIFDIHALQEKFYFGDNVIPQLKSAVPLLRKVLPPNPDVAVAFPDEGADKRFRKILHGYNQIFCSKKREKKKRSVRIESGDPTGKHVVIVDDRALSGGTLLAAKDALLEKGAAEVSVFVTHGVFPQDSWQNFRNAGFSNVWITDSCPSTVQRVVGQNPFKVLSLDELIHPILQTSAIQSH